MTEKSKLKNDFGQAVPDNQNSLSAGPGGPLLLQDYFLIEKLAHFNRERIPERVVHAKGAGAHGYFEVTSEMSKYCRAAFLNKTGKRTPVFVRFSTVAGEKGSADTERDPRGFAVKFYTDEGNYDMVGNNVPIFFIRDPQKFPDLIHSQKRDPATNLRNPVAAWDFFSLTPEAVHMVTMIFSDRGTPASYRNMNGYSGHTFKWVNAAGEAFWVKLHFKTESGIKTLTRQEACRIAGEDADYMTRDLYNHIAGGQTAAWRVCAQIMPLNQADNYRWNVFDVTKVWSHADYPLIQFGRLVLDRNPENYFQEVEQAAFAPSNLVPGIEPSPDKMLQGRLFAYADAHRYRLGANYHQIPVNCPFARGVHNYQRDGAMRVDGNGGASVNYEPNSFGGPVEDASAAIATFPLSGDVGRTATGGDDFAQAGMLWRLMSESERANLVGNLAQALGPVPRQIQLRQLAHFSRADSAYGSAVAAALGIEPAEIEKSIVKAAR